MGAQSVPSLCSLHFSWRRPPK